MNTSNMKNIVVLRDLPSNLVEEAIVVLKENQKLKKVELVDVENNKTKEMPEKNKKINKKDYIIKEAQMLIADYITKVENKNKGEEKQLKNLKKKCFKLKVINAGLIVCLMISFAVGCM